MDTTDHFGLYEQIRYSEVKLHSFICSITTKIESGLETVFVHLLYCSVT
jgi:hypothetical protein